MGNEVKVLDVQVENGGTLIQVDFEADGKKDRMFIPLSQILIAINNQAYQAYDRKMLDMGFELEDPENYKNPNLLSSNLIKL